MEHNEETTRLWGGRFSSGPSPEMVALSLSVHFDWRLAKYDLQGSRAHARVLHAAGLLDADELDKMLAALDELEKDVENGSFQGTEADEDVHTALERGLIERLGTLGGKLRAGRSRNDQVATDLRLYLRDQVRAIAVALIDLQQSLLKKAQEYRDVVAPGMTHLQHAQPILFSHQLLAHVHAFARDFDRLRDWDRRASVSPLGAGALAGSSLALDPVAVANDLGFDRPADNSIDAVSDRDYVAEFLFAAALIGVHLSRIGEEVVLWTTTEFGWVSLHDSWATGSSIMPQKKNPDIGELARGKTGRFVGNLMSLLTTLKALPLAYDRDLQEDKECTFDSVEQLLLLIPAVSGMIATMTVNADNVSRGAGEGHALATDVAEWLVRQGIPFREAHEISGAAVRECDERGCELYDLTADDLASIDSRLTAEVLDVLTVDGALASRSTHGGTAPSSVLVQMQGIKDSIASQKEWLEPRQ